MHRNRNLVNLSHLLVEAVVDRDLAKVVVLEVVPDKAVVARGKDLAKVCFIVCFTADTDLIEKCDGVAELKIRHVLEQN